MPVGTGSMWREEIVVSRNGKRRRKQLVLSIKECEMWVWAECALIWGEALIPTPAHLHMGHYLTHIRLCVHVDMCAEELCLLCKADFLSVPLPRGVSLHPSSLRPCPGCEGKVKWVGWGGRSAAPVVHAEVTFVSALPSWSTGKRVLEEETQGKCSEAEKFSPSSRVEFGTTSCVSETCSGECSNSGELEEQQQ